MADRTACLKLARHLGYTVQAVIGQGNFGKVHCAVSQLHHKSEVALKLFRKHSYGTPDEVKILRKMNHRNVVAMLATFSDDRYCCIVMEFCPSGSLKSYLTQNVQELHVQTMMQQLAAAIQYMRSKNVSHFDLKPENILVSLVPDFTLKVTDFGLARIVDDEQVLIGIIGTRQYMAPEVVVRQKFGAKADLWSLGMIMYEMLFGIHPLATMNTRATRKFHSKPKIRVPSHLLISSGCSQLLHGLLKGNPRERISFKELYTHPFLNLDHAPETESLRVKTLIKQDKQAE